MYLKNRGSLNRKHIYQAKKKKKKTCCDVINVDSEAADDSCQMQQV